MSVALLPEPPLAWTAELGPYRLADYERLPDDTSCELVFGRFYLSPSPSVVHQVVALLLLRLFDDLAVRSGGLALSAPLDVVLADHSVVQPDLVYISRESKRIVKARIEGAPTLVVEILSPGTSRRDRGEKLALYAEAGVEEYWVVDPIERQIEFLVNRQGRFLVALPERGEYRSEILPDLWLGLADFWRQLEDRLR